MRAKATPLVRTLSLIASASLLGTGCSGLGASSVSPPPTVTVTVTPTTTASTRVQLDWATLISRARGSVVRFQVRTCDEQGTGSGFLVGDHLVMTAAHVVDQAVSISLATDTAVTTAQVIAIDRQNDSALVRTNAAFAASQVRLSASQPAQGADIAVLGYPLGTNELRVSQGVVSGLDEDIEIPPYAVTNAMVTDAAINAGNSGGPVFDRYGEVVGLVTAKRFWTDSGSGRVAAEGTGYVVPSISLLPRLNEWRNRRPLVTPRCPGASPNAQSPGSDFPVRVGSTHPDAASIASSLAAHGQAINQGEYEVAYNMFTPRMASRVGSMQVWASGLNTSFWTSLDLDSVVGSDGKATAVASFRTRQESAQGPQGQTCSVWRNEYQLVLSESGAWLIDGARRVNEPTAC